MKRLTTTCEVSLTNECTLDFTELAVEKVLDVSYETKAQGFGMTKMPLNYLFDIDTCVLTITNPGDEYSAYEIKEVIIDYFSLKEERKIKLKEILK
jgi:hypothetical protein